MIDFWKAVGTRDLKDEDDVAAALRSVSARLGDASPLDLTLFDDRLREYLFRLDRREFASIEVALPDGTALPQTNDHFLYARCACVLAGEREFSTVLQTGSGFEKYTAPVMQSAEGLLYVGQELYESRTGREFSSRSEFRLEWMSNTAGWAGR